MIYYHGVILIQIHGTKSELSLYDNIQFKDNLLPIL